MSKKFIDDDVMSADYDVIIIFQVDGWFGTIRNPDTRRMVYKS